MVALVLSVALHGVLLVVAPGFVGKRHAPVRLSALEVTMRAPVEPLPGAAPQPALRTVQPAPARQRERPRPEPAETLSATAQWISRPGPGVETAGAADAPMDPDRSVVAVPARVPEPLPAAPRRKTAAAEAQVAPASLSAAYLDNPAPRYPDAARRLGQEGTVTLRVLVTAGGIPARVALEQSSGSSHLDGAALERVRNWRFKPASQGSVPIESWVIVPIVFRLEGAS